jgi:pimeloyl-ACP methyl ester carboxylesterase
VGVIAAAGLRLTEHELEVALHPGSEETLTIFAREVADPDGLNKPFLLFLQGGPGFESPRPAGPATAWMKRALQDFRVLLLDQRGTGRSGIAPTSAERLQHYRADAIVRDCEALREHLGVERWAVLGQSFGGLCVYAYLSAYPEHLSEAFVTGGIPVLGNRIEDVYRVTYGLVAERTRRYFERYPADRARVDELLERDDIVLPGGDRLTPGRVRALGRPLGMSDGAENLHHLLELDPASPAFLHDVERVSEFPRNPIYAVLHDACWADGGTTRWAAERVYGGELLTGEHMFPSVFDEIAEMRPFRDAAHALAEHEWPRLYDEDRLSANEVPCAAAIYAHDMYIPRVFSEETAARTGRLRTWLTDEYEHNGLRADGGRVLGRLIDLARDRI